MAPPSGPRSTSSGSSSRSASSSSSHAPDEDRDPLLEVHPTRSAGGGVGSSGAVAGALVAVRPPQGGQRRGGWLVRWPHNPPKPPEVDPEFLAAAQLRAGMLGLVVSVALGLVLGVGLPPQRDTSLGLLSSVLGWTYFTCWSITFYFQLQLNYLRKSVVGLSFDFLAYNLLGFVSYTIYNTVFFFSGPVRSAYRSNHEGHETVVMANDVAFSWHAVVLLAGWVAQCCHYHRGDQAVSRLARGLILSTMAGVAILCVFTLVDGGKQEEWNVVLHLLGMIKVAVTCAKYVPQVILIHAQQGTKGWPLWNVVLDLLGGSLSLSQQIVDCYDEGDWGGLLGNPAKLLLGNVTVVFDVIFLLQHFCIYRNTKPVLPP